MFSNEALSRPQFCFDFLQNYRQGSSLSSNDCYWHFHQIVCLNLLEGTRICFTKRRVPDISGNFGIKLGKDAWETIPVDFSVGITFPLLKIKASGVLVQYTKNLLFCYFFLNTSKSRNVVFCCSQSRINFTRFECVSKPAFWAFLWGVIQA